MGFGHIRTSLRSTIKFLFQRPIYRRPGVHRQSHWWSSVARSLSVFWYLVALPQAAGAEQHALYTSSISAHTNQEGIEYTKAK